MTRVRASLLALGLTILILRSIVVPLGGLTAAMKALTGGRTDIDLPPDGDDEIGQMSRTLAMFRDGLIERNRLSEEREQALKRLEIARDEATAANRILQVTFDHMAQGVAMFDGDFQAGPTGTGYRVHARLPTTQTPAPMTVVK